MALNIPPIGTKGLYDLRSPFTIASGQVYTCAAVRFFKDIENQGINVFNRYYAPYDIDIEDYQTDRSNNVVIVTLISDTERPIYVPSSYITAFPNLNTINYQHVVLSVSLGPIPTYVDLTFVKDQIASVVSDVIGVQGTVKENVAGTSGVVTHSEHSTLEIARQAAIVNRTTDYSKVLEQQQTIDLLNDKIRSLEQMVLDLSA